MSYADRIVGKPADGPDKLTRKGTYPLGDYLPYSLEEQIIAKHAPHLTTDIKKDWWIRDHVRLQWDGQPPRPIKAGEWYLSGSIIAGYTVKGDIITPYHAAKLVIVKSVTVVTETVEAI